MYCCLMAAIANTTLFIGRSQILVVGVVMVMVVGMCVEVASGQRVLRVSFICRLFGGSESVHSINFGGSFRSL